MARYAAPDGWILQAYRYALDPTPRQEQQLRSHARASRFAWNWGLARCQQRYAAERKWYSGVELHRRSLRRLRRASRAHSRRAKGSANRRKAAARLARVHARAADVRADALHKAITELATRYETVVVEDLNVTGMLASRSLARAVADQGFGAVRRMLVYKTTWNGGQLIVADRWYPSSKTCSRCGWRKPSLTLKERVFCCQACGLVLDRDVNAAINLLKLAPGTASGAGTGPGDGPTPAEPR
jgi:IS605 OrfB family transposase